MISPNDLSYFLEITKTKNLSRAAERLGISQPSLSLALKRIEANLGTQVFIRSKRGVHLTKGGEQLLKHTNALFQYWNKVKIDSISSMNQIRGSVSIGCHPSVALYSLNKFLPQIVEDNPLLEISLEHDLSRKIAEQIISFKLDIGLVINPVKHPDLIIHKLLTDKVTLWSSKKINKNNNHHNDQAVLICDPSLLQTQDLLKKIKKNKIKFSRVITSQSLENITSLTQSGAGIGIIPTRIVKRMGASQMKTILNAPIFKDQLSLIYRVENKNISSIKCISQAVLDWAAVLSI